MKQTGKRRLLESEKSGRIHKMNQAGKRTECGLTPKPDDILRTHEPAGAIICGSCLRTMRKRRRLAP